MRASSTPPSINEPEDMATIAMRNDIVMDTRTPSPNGRRPTNNTEDTESTEKYKPDLSAEVAMLSTKLVNAINYQTNLDDSLQQARHELEQARQELTRLRAEKQEVDTQKANGVLVQRSTMDRALAKLRAEVATERAAREASDKAKKETDSELENLTTALFEEANTMVAAARKDTEAVEKRNSQLRSQLNDTELLLASQQEQLRDLKDTMEKMERTSEYESTGQRDIMSMPSTPITANFEALNLSPSAASAMDIPPEHPLHFSHLLSPVVRQDINAYNEFQELVTVGGRATPVPHSRNTSNSHSSGPSSSQPNLSANAAISSPNMPGAFSFSASSSPQSATFSQSGPALKETKFYKRIVIEDLEPTLRLDLAPGLNLFSRRTVLSSLLQGTLVVEPFMPSAKFHGPIFACALCGESRKNEPYIRKHRFRTSEEDNAQRYPLCDYCLNRVRASGDFVGFLRMLRDGHWKAESTEEQKSAWEESVRLRERMFWARLGGGVVPIHQGPRRELTDTPSTAAIKSGRPSLDSVSELRPKSNFRGAPLLKTPSPQDHQTLDRAKDDSSEPTESEDERPSSVMVSRAAVGSSSATQKSMSPAVSIHRPSEDGSSASEEVQKSTGSQEAASEHKPEGEKATTDDQHESAISTTKTNEDTESSASVSETPTPFEDAQSEVKELGANAEPSPQTETETAASKGSTKSSEPVVPATTPTPPEPENTSTTSTSASTRRVTPPKKLSPSADTLSPNPTPSAKPDRRPSGVLARVRAMEAQSQTKAASGTLGKRPAGSLN